MEYVEFKVDDRPLVYWDWQLGKKNLEYLRGMDPSYFSHVLDANIPHLDGERHMQAALAIRLAFYQAQETLFALLCSAIQAPNCVIGWKLSYKNQDLMSVVRKVSEHQPVYCHERYRPVSWENMATHVFAYASWPEEKLCWLREGFGRFWSSMARDFIDPRNISEYNALKHGLRPRPGGFRMAIGLQTDPETPCPREQMQSIGGSDTGSSFFLKEPVGQDAWHLRPRRVGKNWSVGNTVNGLALITMSIEDTVSFLRIENGDEPSVCRFTTPDSEDAFKAPWAEPIGARWSSLDSVVSIDDIEPWSRDEVKRHLDEDESAE